MRKRKNAGRNRKRDMQWVETKDGKMGACRFE